MTGTINTLGIINPVIAPIAIVISVSTSILQSSWAETIETTNDNSTKAMPYNIFLKCTIVYFSAFLYTSSFTSNDTLGVNDKLTPPAPKDTDGSQLKIAWA